MIKGQINLFDLASFMGCDLAKEPEQPVLLEAGQTVYMVNKGDVREAKVLGENWILPDNNRGYRLQYLEGAYGCAWNDTLDKECFRNPADALAIAEKYLSEHEVILAQNIHSINTVAYQYIRKSDGRTMTAFYCELDNGMVYIKEFMTFHHMIVADKKQKAIKQFMDQDEFKHNEVVQIKYEPVFKNMYRINQKYDWDYAEAEHSYAVG